MNGYKKSPELIFVDMDNTIAENKTCKSIEFYEGMYAEKRSIRIVIDAILNTYPASRIYILSKTQGGERGRIEKREWLERHCPDMTLNRPRFIEPNQSKCTVICALAASRGIKSRECLIIDDNKSVLQECDKAGIQTLYPQQVICEYESRKIENKTC